MIQVQQRIQDIASKDQTQIMIVESTATVATSLSQQFRCEGFQVSMAKCGNDALNRLIFEEEPNLIVTDINLNDMDGFVFASQVRIWSTVPIVVVSHIADPFIIAEAITEFADDYVTVPFAFEELAARVDRILRHYP